MIRQEDLLLIQNVQMQIMDEIHRVCITEGYRYYLIGGSALGAVRHNGIIPWDVDIDIAMPRKDYEAFLAEGCKRINPRFGVHDYRTDKDYGTVHALVVLKESSLFFKGDLNNNRNNRYGIFVDILPLDQFPNDEKLKIKQIKDLSRINTLRYFYQGSIESNDGKMERMAKFLLQKFLHCFVSIQYLNRKQQEIVQRYDTEDEGTIWCSMLSHYSIDKLTMPKSYFGKPKLMEFSGRQYYVPEKTEQYLSQLFGDYMKLPSEEKRREQIDSVYYACWYSEKNNLVEIING